MSVYLILCVSSAASTDGEGTQRNESISFAVNNVVSNPADRSLPRWKVRPEGTEGCAAKYDEDIKPFPTSSACELVSPDARSTHSGLLERQPHGHGFISAVTTAFDLHLPLTLRPEHLWVLVLQGVARHVVANAEDLRKEFVSHEGKEQLKVHRHDVEWQTGCSTRGAAPEGLDWAGVVAEFSDQIAARTVPGVVELVDSDFSTTTPTERVVSQVTVMDMLQE